MRGKNEETNFIDELIQDVTECDIRLYWSIRRNEKEGIGKEDLIRIHRHRLVKERLKIFEAYELVVQRGERFYPGPRFFRFEIERIGGLPKNSDIFYSVFRTPLAEIILMIINYYKPITIKEVHEMVVKEAGCDVHYNIVYRLIKRMEDYNIISKESGRYVSNLFWMFPSVEELKQKWLEYLNHYHKRDRATEISV